MKNTLQKFNTFIFDLDGTLIDLENVNYEAARKALQELAGLDLDEKNYLRYFAGTRIVDAFAEYFSYIKREESEESIDNFVKKFREIKEYYLTHKLRETSKPIGRAIEFLQEAKNEGKKLCLATSTIKKFSDIILQEYKIYDYFDVIITAEDVEKGKPDPEIYTLALKKMNTTETDAVVFEDSYSGILAAKNAVIFTIGIRSKGRNDEEVKGADLVIDDYFNLK